MITGIKLIAFDVDGTIYSSEGIIGATYQEAIGKFIQSSGINIKIPSSKEIMAQIGKPVKTIFANLLPQLPEADRDKISDDVLVLLCEKTSAGKGHYYEGVYEVFEYLKNSGFILTIASNGRRRYVETVVQTIKIDKFIEEIAILDYTNLKNKGDILNFYRTKYRLKGREILMVGDRDSDKDAATQNNSYFAFCKYGHAPIGEINEWDILLESIRGLRSTVSM